MTPTIIAFAAIHALCPRGAVVWNDRASVVQHGEYYTSETGCSAVVVCDQDHVLVFRGTYIGKLDSPALCAKWLHRRLVRYQVGPRPGHPCVVTVWTEQDCDFKNPEDAAKLQAAERLRLYPNAR